MSVVSQDQVSVERRVRDALERVLGAGVVSCDASTVLRESEAVRYDSVTAVECVAAIEDEFGIEVDFVADDVRYSFASIGNIAELVEQKLADLRSLGG